MAGEDSTLINARSDTGWRNGRITRCHHTAEDLIDAPPSVLTEAWVRVRPSAWGLGPMNGCQVRADQGSPLGLHPI